MNKAALGDNVVFVAGHEMGFQRRQSQAVYGVDGNF